MATLPPYIVSACGARTGLDVLSPQEDGAADVTSKQDAATRDAFEDAKLVDAGVVRVFVTDGVFAPKFGGLSGGDAICENEAASAGLSGTFAAWLADSEGSPATRFVRSSGPYMRTDGVLIASDWNDLTDGMIAAPIDVTASAMPVALDSSFNLQVWSNVAKDGSAVPPDSIYGPGTCDDWSYAGAQALGGVGQLNEGGPQSGGIWTDSGEQRCDVYENHLYCFEQPQ